MVSTQINLPPTMQESPSPTSLTDGDPAGLLPVSVATGIVIILKVPPLFSRNSHPPPPLLSSEEQEPVSFLRFMMFLRSRECKLLFSEETVKLKKSL